MARYWVYLNDEVAGPYGVDQLIRLRGFSRQTLVCIDEAGGQPKNWISPAEIPELAHIFKAVDEHMAEPVSPPPKAAAKSRAPRPTKPFVPAVTLRSPKWNIAQFAGWLLLATALIGGGVFAWSIYSHRTGLAQDQEAVRMLIENVHLPAPSPYATLPQYFQDKNVQPRWEFEKKQDGLYGGTLSLYVPLPQGGTPTLSVYAFEVNLPAQTVRGVNSAASKLLSEGFPAPAQRKAAAAPAPKKSSPAESFGPTLDGFRAAVEGGDYQTVWNAFSARKRSEMNKAGISAEGFVRLQGLTHRVETGMKQAVLKTKPQSDSEMLVLIKQTQDDRPDVFIKQLWVYENDAWKLDDEQKKSSAAVPEPAAPAPPTGGSPQSGTPAAAPASLPGMSN